MENNEFEDPSNPLMDLIKKIAVWIVVIFLALMLIAVVIFQPRFFTFVQ